MPNLMGNFNITSRCSAAYRDSMLAQFGLTDAQYPYLLRICRRPGITQDELSRQLCIHKSNVARQIALLEQNGFVERREDENDRRIRHLYPTEKTLELHPQIRGILRTWNRYITADLSAEEYAMLEDLIERVSKKAIQYFESGTLAEAWEGEGKRQ